MKLAVMSCIHGNYEALTAVLSDIEAQKADRVYCLGDLVGYGPYPNEVVELIRDLEIPTCQGCWDEDVVEGLDACECSYPSQIAEKRGKLAHEWTNRVLKSDVRDYLANLPIILKEDNLCFVHGSPNSQHEYLLPDTAGLITLERILSTGADTLFCGHTHIPYVRELDNMKLSVRVQEPEKMSNNTLTTPMKRLINAGSVGEPRHGKPDATYVLYDTETEEVTLREVPYNYTATCLAILEQGLPPIFAWRLARGLEFAEKADDPTHVCQK